MRSLFVIASLVVAVASAQGQSLRAEADAAGKAIGAAMKKKDFAALSKAMKASCTKDFVYIEKGVKGPPQNIDQVIEGIKMGLSSMSKVTVADAKILSLKEKGNTGWAKAQHTMGGITAGPDKKNHTMIIVGTVEETYVKQGGKWKMSKMVWLSQKMTMDGKPMDPAMMGGGH